MRETTGEKIRKRRRILLIAANPADTSGLQLAKEFRKIKKIIKNAKESDLFDIEQTEATQFADLRCALLDYKPHIVHFSGHGVEDGILLENEQGSTQTISTQVLTELIKLSNENNTIECVILNACDSQASAEAISEHVKYAIGMNAPVGDQAAISFAIGFYDTIVKNFGYKKAYQFGKNEFNSATDQNQRGCNFPQSDEETKKTQIVSPKLFEKPQKQHPLNHSSRPTEEQTNKTPWFYHTIDHDQLQTIDLFKHDDKLVFGHFIAKGSEAPESFVKHCYIKMLGGSCDAEDDIEQSYHFIILDGVAKNSFENGLFKKSQMESLQPLQNQHQVSHQVKSKAQQKQAAIRHWLVDERTIVVLYIPLTNEQQHHINPIVQGAIDTLTALNLGNLKVLTLFRGNTALPKKRWRFFAKKQILPTCCLEMKPLAPHLTEDDIYDWIPHLKALGIDSQLCEYMKKKLMKIVREELVNYEEMLSHLREIKYSRVPSNTHDTHDTQNTPHYP